MPVSVSLPPARYGSGTQIRRLFTKGCMYQGSLQMGEDVQGKRPKRGNFGVLKVIKWVEFRNFDSTKTT